MPPKRRSPSQSTEGQISLFGQRETPDAFRKAVQVVHSKPKSPLSLLQRKLGNAWLKHAIENPPDQDGWWELGIRALAENIGFDSNNRQYLKESAEALMRIVFEWDVMAPANKRVHWKASVLFPEIEIRSDAIRYQISSQMRERMMNPEIYAMIDMNIVRRFRRAPSLAIWEFCVRFEKIGRTAEVEWEKCRDMVLGESADSKTYQEYKYFKSKVLNPAIAEINAESRHLIELVETKLGKRVVAIRFDVRKKSEGSDAPADDRALEIVGELVRLGVPQSEANRLAQAHPFEDVRAALDYTKKRMNDRKLAKLENPAAYFRQALTQRYAPPSPAQADGARDARPSRTVDLKEAFAARRAQHAERYFAELDLADQAALIERYNAQQATPPLQLKKRSGKLAQAAFYGWLALETWGTPTAEELLEFAQQMLEAER